MFRKLKNSLFIKILIFKNNNFLNSVFIKKILKKYINYILVICIKYFNFKQCYNK